MSEVVKGGRHAIGNDFFLPIIVHHKKVKNLRKTTTVSMNTGSVLSVFPKIAR